MDEPCPPVIPVIKAMTDALSVLFKPGQLIEVRAITDDGVASGYFNDQAALANAVSPLDTLPGVQGIYVTLERVNNPALPARRLCRTCHGDALLKEQASGVPLPGILPVGSMVKVSRDLGRCSVCDMGSAAWYDEDAKVKLCDYCYNREIARQAGGSEQEGMCQ